MMLTLKQGFDFGEVARRGLDAAHGELLERLQTLPAAGVGTSGPSPCGRTTRSIGCEEQLFQVLFDAFSRAIPPLDTIVHLVRLKLTS
jgi:hypothetical protein